MNVASIATKIPSQTSNIGRFFILGEVEIQKFEFNDAQDKQKLVILQCKKFIDFF